MHGLSIKTCMPRSNGVKWGFLVLTNGGGASICARPFFIDRNTSFLGTIGHGKGH